MARLTIIASHFFILIAQASKEFDSKISLRRVKAADVLGNRDADEAWEYVDNKWRAQSVREFDNNKFDKISSWEDFKKAYQSEIEVPSSEVKELDKCVRSCKRRDYFRDMRGKAHEELMEHYNKGKITEKPIPCADCCEKIPRTIKADIARFKPVYQACSKATDSIKCSVAKSSSIYRKSPSSYYANLFLKYHVGNMKTYDKSEDKYIRKDKQLRKKPKCPFAKTSKYRTPDGTCNSPAGSRIGAKGSIFRRMHEQEPTNLNNPDPRIVAEKLLIPQPGQERIISDKLNQLLAIWLQWMIHDWVVVSRSETDFIDGYGPFAPEIEWADKKNNLVRNNVTHWWDSSMIYGSDLKTQKKIRTMKNGKIKVGKEHMLRDGTTGAIETGFAENWWTGLEWITTLFAKEHNYIAEQIKKNNRNFKDEEIFQKTRLVISAIINKIHTIEWTPVLFDNGRSTLAQHSIWDEEMCKNYAADELSGVEKMMGPYICGLMQRDSEKVAEKPWGFTNSFISVYRLHQLLPDNVKFSDEKDLTLAEMLEDNGTDNAEIFDELGFANIGQGFMKAGLGVPALWNYPKGLTSEHGGFKLNLPALEIYRDRQLGQLRYKEWTKMMNLPVPEHWCDISHRPEVIKVLQEVYDKIEDVDLIIGLYAHFDKKNLPGHVVVDPSYILFVLQTPMRTHQDRFFRKQKTAEYYTQWGIDYLDETMFVDVLERHGHTVEDRSRGGAFRIKN